MKRRTLLMASLGLSLGAKAREGNLEWHERHVQGLGTLLHFKVAHADRACAHDALDAAVQALREIEAELSLFQPDSALCRLNRNGRLRAGPHLETVMRAALTIAQSSAGAFDPTVQPLWEMAQRACLAGRLPTPEERAAARARVDWRAVRMIGDDIVFDRPGMAVTLNGIAQGYATDRVRCVLKAHGIQNALIDAGEFSALGRNDRQGPWTLGIEDPQADHGLLGRLCLDGRSAATSADNHCFFTSDHLHHHIFDPHTGDSPPGLSSVTVVDASTMRADALTKVMFVGGPQRIRQLARHYRVGVIWLDRQGRCGATPDLAWTPDRPAHAA